MNRREALHRVGILMGGAVSSSVLAGVFAGCRADTGAYTPQTLTADQHEVVAAVAELIIPTTDTPGARGAGVHVFIDQMLTRGYTAEERDHFLAGLADLDARAPGGSGFLAATPEEQTEILTMLEAEARARRRSDDGPTPFFRMMKELTLTGYYTSEVGATQELQYVHVAGSYKGDIPLSEAGRAYS